MLENIAGTSDHSQPTSSNAGQGNSQSSDDDSPNGKGVKSSLPGILYQLKLSMLFLQTALDKKYSFELYSEKEDAEKFDDVIFKYDKDRQYRFLQAKHKLHPEKGNITIGKLLSKNSEEPFCLQKYFISFREIQKKQQYKDKIKDLIICTNVDFSNDIDKKKRLTKQEEYDDILYIGDGECYKLNFDENNEDIIEQLKDACNLKILAKKLAISFSKDSFNKKMDLRTPLFKAYHIPLVKQVFDKKLVKDNKKISYCTFKKDFIERKNLSPEVELLREAFEEEVKNRQPNINNLWSTLSNKKIPVSSRFGEQATESTSTKPDLSNDFVEDNEIKDFFEKLVFAVKQPNEEKLGNLIQNKIFNTLDYLNNDNDQAEFIYCFVQKEMLTWLKDSKSVVLKKKDDFFMMGREKIKKIMHVITDLVYSCYIKKLKIKFNNTSKEIKELSTFLSSKDKIFNHISFDKNISLGEAKVYQIKQQSGWCLQNLLNLKQFGNNKAENLFINNLLIIVCKDESEIEREHIKELYAELVNSIRKDNNKKIILITESNSNLAEFFKLGDFKNNYREKLCQITVRDLDENYLRKQLMEKKITFQGQQRNLALLLNIGDESKELTNLSKEVLGKLEKVLKSETLSEFIFSKNIVVGNKLPNFTDDNSPYYDFYYINIPRTFSHQIITKNSLQECINKRNCDLFAFPSTMNEYCLNNLGSEERIKIRNFSEMNNMSEENFFEGRFFILDDHHKYQNFEELRDQCNGKNIHWLTSIDKNDDKFKVEYSKSISNLQEFMKLENLGEEIEYSSRVIIIGDPGVGKSTTLTTYFQKLDKHSWPIRINLKDYQEYIKIAKFNNIDKIVKFLCRSDLKGFESVLAKSLLKYYLEYGNQVILLLDGYDEIENNNQEKVIELLRSFPTDSKIWITTRSNQQYKIEDALGNTFSYFLNPFNEKEQEEFLTKYWIKKLNVEPSDEKEKDNINEFTKKLLEHFHHIGLMTRKNLVGIVLQARMIADTCLKYYGEFNNHNSFKLEINNISNLYEKFVEFQYERYFSKINIDKNFTYNNLRIVLNKLYSKIHGYFALNVLFHEDQLCKEYLRSQTYREFPKDTLNDIGLIKNFKENYFVHFTYAEYFVSKLLVNMLGKNKNYFEYKLAREFLLKNIFLNRNKLIRHFLEHEVENIYCNKECDISNKWKEIEKCDLLTKREETRGIWKTLPFVDSDVNVEIRHNDVESNKTLSELIKDVESCITESYNDTYYYNGDTKLINKLFKKFLKETDIEKLESTLKYLIKRNGKSLYNFANNEFLRDGNMDFAIIYYLIQARLQNKYNESFENMILKQNHKTNLKNFICLLKELQRDTKNIVEFLIPVPSEDDEEFTMLYYKYYCVNMLNKNIIKDINSIKSSQETCTKKIIDFLEKVNVRSGFITKYLKKRDLTYLQPLFIDVTHHPNIIAYTKWYINKIYNNERNFYWLERQGILISGFLKILTPEMSKIFNSELKKIRGGFTDIYCSKILFDLIIYFINTMETEVLPQVDKLAFLTMVVQFSTMEINNNQSFPFNLNQIKTTLKLIENMLKKEHKPIVEVSESVKYLYILRKVGLRLINFVDQKILVLDPGGNLRFELSSNYKNQIIELLRWKDDRTTSDENRNQRKDDYDFIEKCYDIIISKKYGLKRSSSENNLQILNKRLKV